MHCHGPPRFAVREEREVVWQEKARAHGKEMSLKHIFNDFFWNLYIQLFPLGKAHKGNTFQHRYDVMNLEKQVRPLCAQIISQPMRHTISFMPYPLNLLPHVSSNNVGHLELKNLSAYLFVLVYQLKCLEFWGLQYIVGKVLRSISHVPKNSKITIEKRKKKKLQLYSNCSLSWSKEPQWEDDCGSFSHNFYTKYDIQCFIH